MPAGTKPASPRRPDLQEKSSREGEARAPYTKPTQGGQVENTKVIEITLVKELGKNRAP